MSDNPFNAPNNNSNSLLNALLNQDRYLMSTTQSTTPAGSPPQARGAQRTASQDGNLLYGHAAPFQMTTGTSSTAAGKRAADPASDPEDDHDMQGKDVPTVFKRARRRSRDDPFQAPASAGLAEFLPIPPAVYYFNPALLREGFAAGIPGGAMGTPPGFPRNIAAPQSGGGTGAGNVPTNAGDSTATSAQAGPSTPARGVHGSRRRRRDESASDEEQGFTQVADDDGADDEGADDEGDGGTASPRRKGKGRASNQGNRDSGHAGPTQFSTFATQSEVSLIRSDLHQLNHSMSHLVNLVDRQTQFFSTLEARGLFGHPAASQPSPTQTGAAQSQGPVPMDVDQPAFVPLARRPRRGRASEPKPKGLPIQRDSEDVILADRIRSLTRELMKRKSAKDPITSAMLPTDEQVGDYDPYNGPACTIQDFRPDLGSSTSSAWNISVMELFVMHFIEKYPTAARDRVEDLFQVHLKYLCTKWQASFCNPDTLRQRQRLLNRSEHQRNLYYRRLTVTHSYAELRRHIPMLMALGVKGMSSDESDHRNGVAQYGVFKKEWRNPLVTRWLRVLDSLYRRLRFADAAENKPGIQPHSRFYSDRASQRRPPVKGLPRNAYDPQWLQDLHPYDRKHLLVQEDVQYDFSHDPELQKLADDYNGQHNPLGLYF